LTLVERGARLKHQSLIFAILILAEGAPHKFNAVLIKDRRFLSSLGFPRVKVTAGLVLLHFPVDDVTEFWRSFVTIEAVIKVFLFALLRENRPSKSVRFIEEVDRVLTMIGLVLRPDLPAVTRLAYDRLDRSPRCHRSSRHILDNLFDWDHAYRLCILHRLYLVVGKRVITVATQIVVLCLQSILVHFLCENVTAHSESVPS